MVDFVEKPHDSKWNYIDLPKKGGCPKMILEQPLLLLGECMTQSV